MTNAVHRTALVHIEDIVEEMRRDNENEATFDMVMRRVSDGVEVVVHVKVLDNAVKVEQFSPTIDDPNLYYWDENLIEDSDELMKLRFDSHDKSGSVELEFVRHV
jgi:hypothetical protein